MRKWILLAILSASLTVPANSAFAFYDDVHYALNYYIARVIGFTPEQAFRMANACVSVDYSFSTEPTQFGGVGNDLIINQWITATTLPIYGLIQGVGHKLLGSSEQWQKASDEIPQALEDLLANQEFKDTFRAQWRFHAFRDTYRFPKSKVDGPPYPTPADQGHAEAADDAIVSQRNILYNESYEIKNLGVFLHYFQDEVPHRGYAIGGGHWVLLPNQWRQSDLWEMGSQGKPIDEWRIWSQWAHIDKRGAIPAGSTTDWLSYRSLDSNLKMIRETANYMIEFMKRASKGKQKPLIDSPERIAEMISPLMNELRTANDAPARLKTVREVIYTKVLQAGGSPAIPTAVDLIGKPTQYHKHTGGPSVETAIKIMNKSLQSKEIENIPPINEPPDPAKLYRVVERTDTTGAVIEQFNESVMFGDLNIKMDDPAVLNKTMDKPKWLEVTVSTVPAQKGEQAYELGKDKSDLFGFDSFAGKETLYTFTDLPMGEVRVQVKYIDSNGAIMRAVEQKVKLEKKLNDGVIKVSGESSNLDAIIEAMKSIGFLDVKPRESVYREMEGPLLNLREVFTYKNSSRNSPGGYLTNATVIPWPDENYAKRHYDHESKESRLWSKLRESFEMGAGSAGVVEQHGNVTYPNSNVLYPAVSTAGYILCGGTVTVAFNHQVESEKSYDFSLAKTPEARGQMQSQFDNDEKAFIPHAKADAKKLLAAIAGALGNFGVCKSTIPASLTTSEDPNAPGINVPGGPSPGGTSGAQGAPTGNITGTTLPTGNTAGGAPQNAAGSPAPASGDWTLNRAWAKNQTPDALRAALNQKISDFFGSPQISDPAAKDAFADISAHIALRQLPASVFNDPYINNPREEHRRWAENQNRLGLKNNTTWKTGLALGALSKEGQEALYADIAQTLSVANQGNNRQPGTNTGGTGNQSFPGAAVNPGLLDPAVANQNPGALEPGINRYGSDYRELNLFTEDAQLCSAECKKEPQCRAWTFVKAGVQGPQPKCWLKSSVPPATADPNTISGVVPVVFLDPAAANQKPGGYELGINRYGNDYRDLSTADAELCSAECKKETQCKSWTFVKAGAQGPQAKCWLKNAVPPATADPNTVSGVVIPFLDANAANSQPSEYELGINRYGSDYRDLNLPSDDAQLCSAECKKETQCQAWTFVKAGAQAAQAKCWLKNSVPPATADPNTVSGVMVRPPVDPATANQNPGEFELGINRYGSDYRDLSTADAQLCSAECKNEAQCLAWTFVKAGVQGPQPKCWLKNAVPPATADPNTISGVIPNRAAAVPVTPPVVVPGNTKDGTWTDWMSVDNPGATGDWDIVSSFAGAIPCKPTAIECRVLSDKRPWQQAGQKYKCSLEEPNPGGICLNADNPPGGCLDYEVRFDCGVSSAVSKIIPETGFTGTWHSEYGDMILNQDGNQVTGTYRAGAASVNGTVTGNILEGEWKQTDRPGFLRFELSQDGKSFNGTWTEANKAGGGSWNGQRA